MEFFHNLLSKGVWYYHSRSPEQGIHFRRSIRISLYETLIRFVPPVNLFLIVQLVIQVIHLVNDDPRVGTYRFSCRGRRLIASAAAMFVPGLYMILHSYELINRDHMMILGGSLSRIGLVRLKRLRSDLWSVTIRNVRPSRYWWKFFIPKIMPSSSLSCWL